MAEYLLFLIIIALVSATSCGSSQSLFVSEYLDGCKNRALLRVCLYVKLLVDAENKIPQFLVNKNVLVSNLIK
jgi:hypothetical protein